ncbi:hypothetical protein H6F86_24420 [Phormidium sp. FACHB-592]|uniref:Uncharacterized protein n=1 Tax=Stenomitos frigidus AS-A4 TaxID=2933935 RepID=A0ABV0KKC8_9CYAN|nr:hypothetical protein [Phormidium sp. FACHB-592]MBD2076973.1 hypothetical protein [Phormidium sp. FACHB-592]
MVESNNDRQYEVETEVANTNPLGSLSGLFGGEMNATTYTVRDTWTGKVYESTNYDADKACESTWEQVERDK